MPISFSCPECKKRLKVAALEKDKKLACPICKSVLLVRPTSFGTAEVSVSAISSVLANEATRRSPVLDPDEELARAVAFGQAAVGPANAVATKPLAPSAPPTASSPSPLPSVRPTATFPSRPSRTRCGRRFHPSLLLAFGVVVALSIVGFFYVSTPGFRLSDPDDEMERKALSTHPARMSIVPPKLDNVRSVCQLPGPVEDLAVGGGGRFILLLVPQARKIVQFDTSEAKVVHEYALASDPVKVAASMNKLIVLTPATRQMERWDLVTHRKEKSASVPGAWEIESALMGSASNGPLLVAAADREASQFIFLDLDTLTPIEMRLGDGHNGLGGKLRASADGHVLGMWAPKQTPTGFQSYLRSGNKLLGRYQHANVGHVIPGPDGNIVYTGAGFFGSDSHPLDRAKSFSKNDLLPRFCLPAQHGNYHFVIAFDDRAESAKTGDSRPATITVHLADKMKPLMTLNGIDLGIPADRKQETGIDFDKRFLMFPEAKLFIVVPHTNDALWIYRLHIEEGLHKSGGDHLHVASRPPATAVRGEAFAYPIIATANRGEVNVQLESSPVGMRLTKTGTLLWQVPENYPSETEDAVLNLRDASGQETTHVVRIMIADPLARGATSK